MASVCIVFTMQRSSARPAMWGSSSEIHAPLWPYCWNLKIEGATGKRAWPEVMPVSRWPMRMESGRSVSKRGVMAGL